MTKKVHFIDCGANIGQSAKWALKKYDIARIDSFEPLPENIEVFRADDGISKDSVTLHENAVWIHDETRVFHSQFWGTRTGSSLIYGKDISGGFLPKPIDVQCIDLARWIKMNVSSENYNILKIDIEGAEYHVIPHLIEQGIESCIDEWFVEFHGEKTPNHDPRVERYVKENLKWTDWGAHLV